VKKLFLVPILVLSLGLFLQLSSNAEEQTVSATVTPLQISMLLSHTEITYGTRAQNAGEVDASTPVTVKNTGTVAERFLIRGGNSVSGDWTMNGTPGTDRFVHRYFVGSNNPSDLTTSNAIMSSNVQPQADIQVSFRLVVPTVITKTAQQTLPIYITAIQQP
jgi:hypothetical protein